MSYSVLNASSSRTDAMTDSRKIILKRIHESCKTQLPVSCKKRKKSKSAILKEQKHVVLHDYHDHSNEDEKEFMKKMEVRKLLAKDSECNEPSYDKIIIDKTRKHKNKGKKGPRGGVMDPFPLKLHRMLEKVEERNLSSVVSWQPHGRSFVVRRPKEFVEIVMPMFFRQTKLTSFQRQLNLYGFSRITQGIDIGAYYHELFLRGKTFLCQGMIRTKIKGTGHKPANSPETEPNFYAMQKISGLSHFHEEESEDEGLSQVSSDSINAQHSEVRNTCELAYASHPKQAKLDTTSTALITPELQPMPSPELQMIGNQGAFLQDAPLDPQAYFSNQQQTSIFNEPPMGTYTYPEPDPIEELISFEGKSFHYLDSNDPFLAYVFSGPDESEKMSPQIYA